MNKTIDIKNSSHLPTTSYKNLKDLQGNLKTISKENLEKLKQSILKYGIFIPKFVWIENNKNYWIEDGHQTIKALVALEKEGYVIPDIPYVKVECNNKKDAAEKLLQINSRYGIINPETTFFEDFDIDLDFINDIEIPELDIKLEELESKIVEDEVPEPPTEPLSKTGDLWLCGKHRILCGDATKEADILKLMDGKKADMVFCDPPYGVDYGSTNNPKYKKRNIEGDKKTDYLNILDFIPLIAKNINNSFYICGTDKTIEKLILKLKEEKAYISCLILWVKDHPVLGMGDYNSQHELLVYGWFTSQHKFYGDHTQKTVWEIDRPIKSELHPTQKPVELPTRAIRNSSKENDIIADFFLGSGTTLIAAHQTGRICYGCEIDPHYIDVILGRYAKFTGDDCIREDGVKWSELKTSSEKRTD